MRWDKPPGEADRLVALTRLLAAPAAAASRGQPKMRVRLP
jgi:hypothetical protein